VPCSRSPFRTAIERFLSTAAHLERLGEFQ
jgi:hypothetical protein